MVVSTENVGDREKYVWGCYGNSIEGAEGIKLGTGLTNTMAISNEVLNFDNCYYISSSQLKNKKYKANYAWSVNVYENYLLSSFKSTKHRIRAIRAF